MKGKTKLLDFVGIGAGKSGTTSLFNYLQAHPKIYMPLEKEAPFFSDDVRFPQGWEQFAKEFFSRAPEDAQWGKITPQYMGDPRVPARLSKMMPNVKLIALLRNPIDRAFSYYRMKARTGKEQRTFEEAVKDQLRDASLAKARRSLLESDIVLDTYIVRGEYGRILNDYLDRFHREQLLVLFSDDLERRPQYVIDSIMEFLGLDPGFSPANLGKKYFVGGERQRVPWLIPVARSMAPLRWLWNVLPKGRRKALLLFVKNEINLASSPPPQLPHDLRGELVGFYQPDVAKLEGLVGQSVPWAEFHVD
jgi:hypothetical protein